MRSVVLCLTVTSHLLTSIELSSFDRASRLYAGSCDSRIFRDRTEILNTPYLIYDDAINSNSCHFRLKDRGIM